MDFTLGLMEKKPEIRTKTLTAIKGTTSIKHLVKNSHLGISPYTGAPIDRKFACRTKTRNMQMSLSNSKLDFLMYSNRRKGRY